ncbi:hypothetical protein [Glaciecola sp. SC05]|uniref:hypothetical protein n=1 Tax=Glaciecola sp. SC05 TaxID=1987355 RepID=UPI00352749F1
MEFNWCSSRWHEFVYHARAIGSIVGFRVIEVIVGAGQRMKKSGFDTFRYGFYPVNRQKSVAKAC